MSADKRQAWQKTQSFVHCADELFDHSLANKAKESILRTLLRWALCCVCLFLSLALCVFNNFLFAFLEFVLFFRVLSLMSPPGLSERASDRCHVYQTSELNATMHNKSGIFTPWLALKPWKYFTRRPIGKGEEIWHERNGWNLSVENRSNKSPNHGILCRLHFK